jgi:RNA polymerase sigma-70 factor, ECF subfamily
MDTISQSDALERLKGGDKAVVVLVFAAYAERVKHYVLPQAIDVPHADDLVQKTFLNLYRYLDSEEWAAKKDEYRSINHLLFRMATHALIDDKRVEAREDRKKKKYSVEPPPPQPIRAEDELLANEADEVLVRGVTNLPADCRGAARLVFLELYTFEQVAEIEEIPLGTVKTLIRRARKLLLKDLRWYVEGRPNERTNRISPSRRSERDVLPRAAGSRPGRLPELPRDPSTEAHPQAGLGDRSDRTGPDGPDVCAVPPVVAEAESD